jgi:hypothetical protein
MGLTSLAAVTAEGFGETLRLESEQRVLVEVESSRRLSVEVVVFGLSGSFGGEDVVLRIAQLGERGIRPTLRLRRWS